MSLIARRINLMNSGSGVDWESIYKGVVDRSISGDLILPNGITGIGTYVFYTCSGLTSVTIPNTVTSIGSYAFRGCSNIASLTIGNSVATLATSAFQDCSKLTDVTIPNSTTTIAGYVFSDCTRLNTITIGNSVTSIGNYAFRNCSALTRVVINATTPPTLANVNAFNNTNNCPIYVPDASVNTYKTANVWSGLASRIFSINDLNNS